MDDSEVEFQDSGDSDSDDDKLEVLRVQDEDSEVKLQKGEAVFEKLNNPVVVHLGCNRTYKASKLSGHNWMGMKDRLKKYISECTIFQKMKWKRPTKWEDVVDL